MNCNQPEDCGVAPTRGTPANDVKIAPSPPSTAQSDDVGAAERPLAVGEYVTFTRSVLMTARQDAAVAAGTRGRVLDVFPGTNKYRILIVDGPWRWHGGIAYRRMLAPATAAQAEKHAAYDASGEFN